MNRNLYLEVLKGKNVTIDNYYCFYLSGDGEYIHVQGAGSWANRADDKQAFLNDLNRLTEQYASSDVSKWVVA